MTRLYLAAVPLLLCQSAFAQGEPPKAVSAAMRNAQHGEQAPPEFSSEFWKGAVREALKARDACQNQSVMTAGAVADLESKLAAATAEVAKLKAEAAKGKAAPDK